MAYSIDLRERVIAYLKEGHTQEETSIIFKVGTTTIKGWLKLLSETGSLEKRPLYRSPSKFESEKLNAYIEENPDALLKDIAEHFGGSTSGANHALNREKITYKKNDFLQRTRWHRTIGIFRKISRYTRRNRCSIR
jgi:transposase